MRLILIVLLILYHSFAPFCGGWRMIDGMQPNETYFWIGKSAYSFFLEAFVFISGLLAAKSIGKADPSSLDKQFIYKKIKRLLIPSVVFSLLYFLFFYKWQGVFHFEYSIINGCGHLWFLPMLFWCFIGLYIVARKDYHPYAVLGIASILSICYIGAIPFQLGNAMHYFLFFYLGYIIQKYSLASRITANVYPVFFLLPLYLSCFIYSTNIQNITWGGGNS